MQVRAMTERDLARVRDLSGQLGYPLTDEDLARNFRQLSDDRQNCLKVAVDEHDRAIGWIHVAARLSLETGPYAEISGLVVDSTIRRGGVGRELVREGEKWARAEGFTSIRVRSNVARPDSHAFYLAIGYARLKSQHVYDRAL